MLRAAVVLFLATLSTSAWSGMDTPPVSVDTSLFATQSQLSSMASQFDPAGAASAVASQIPQPYSSVPLPAVLNGGVGAPGTYLPGTAQQVLPVQTANATTDASGVFTITWARAFTSASPFIVISPMNTGAQPIVCNPTARSSTAMSGKCFQAGTVTVSLLGAVVNVFSTAATSVPVTVLGREPTQ